MAPQACTRENTRNAPNWPRITLQLCTMRIYKPGPWGPPLLAASDSLSTLWKPFSPPSLRMDCSLLERGTTWPANHLGQTKALLAILSPSRSSRTLAR
jgi:hypothetical protein